MQMPKPSAGAVKLFEGLAERAPGSTVRKMFGQPAAFVHGNLCLGVFGDDVFLRLSESDREAAAKVAGVRPFEPMPGRPMREYRVFPAAVLRDPKRSADWLRRAIAYCEAMPPKSK
jgi:TfoX/Sxy family transcriptional regulator of competence genes